MRPTADSARMLWFDVIAKLHTNYAIALLPPASN